MPVGTEGLDDRLTDGAGGTDDNEIPDAGAFEARPCQRVELIPVVAPNHPLAASATAATDSELATHLHLVLADDTPEPESGPRRSRRWRLNDAMARRELVLAGVGWCTMPRHQVADDLVAGRLVRVRARHYGKRGLQVPRYAAHAAGRTLGPAGAWWFDRL